MNINRVAIVADARRVYFSTTSSGHADFYKAVDTAIDAVLAEVAKHNTPDKAAYYKMGERKPTKEDAGSRGQVLHWWSNRYWAAIHFENLTEDDLWMPMPPPPISAEESAFQDYLQSECGLVYFNHGKTPGEENAARSAWEAAKAHFSKA